MTACRTCTTHAVYREAMYRAYIPPGVQGGIVGRDTPLPTMVGRLSTRQDSLFLSLLGGSLPGRIPLFLSVLDQQGNGKRRPLCASDSPKSDNKTAC